MGLISSYRNIFNYWQKCSQHLYKSVIIFNEPCIIYFQTPAWTIPTHTEYGRRILLGNLLEHFGLEQHCPHLNNRCRCPSGVWKVRIAMGILQGHPTRTIANIEDTNNSHFRTKLAKPMGIHCRNDRHHKNTSPPTHTHIPRPIIQIVLCENRNGKMRDTNTSKNN